ncbi:Small RNA 2'-O-methyltransferase [Mortierella claussenii]|nr:Small RNA 2'-O-methyltransferase [Mortierella claussenii]
MAMAVDANEDNAATTPVSSTSEAEDQSGEDAQEARFFPALWQQRRNLAGRIIAENHATSVIDFGCGEGALTSFLIWENVDDYPITHITSVDLDHDSIKLAEEMCQPQEFELGSNLRVNELVIELYQGSVADADERFIGYDALACLEVIEHLDPDVLGKFWGVVLGTLRPKLVIVSTPNAEFNVYFPQLRYGTPESIFRNDDHRFEWTREEFETWCKSAAKQYGYSVSFTGVGLLPQSDRQVGYCTQIAVLHEVDLPRSPEVCTAATQHYALVSRTEYPVYSQIHTEEEILDFLLDRIARMRPRPPASPSEDDDLSFGGWKNHDPDTHDTVIKEVDGGADDNNVANSGFLEPELEPVELGVLPLDDLWLALDVRQRCKRKARMIEVLGKSALLRLDLERDRLVFNEEDEYWVEWDRREAEEMAARDAERLNFLSDHDQYSDAWEDEVEESSAVQNIPPEDWDQYQVHVQGDGSWDQAVWDTGGGTLAASIDEVDVNSPWMSPACRPAASGSADSIDPWKLI